MATLGVNVDHVAVLREARKVGQPEPVLAALIAEMAGATCITIHLREDRRHIQDRDLILLRQLVKTKLNLEMAATDEMVNIALETKPDMCTLVPEKRQELTTEGGLDVRTQFDSLKSAIEKLKNAGIIISLFVDPDKDQLLASRDVGAEFIELHTGPYADALSESAQRAELETLIESSRYAIELGLRVNAGHGLNYHNVVRVARIEGMEELNIGQSIVAQSVFVGFERAVREMVKLI